MFFYTKNIILLGIETLYNICVLQVSKWVCWFRPIQIEGKTIKYVRKVVDNKKYDVSFIAQKGEKVFDVTHLCTLFDIEYKESKQKEYLDLVSKCINIDFDTLTLINGSQMIEIKK